MPYSAHAWRMALPHWVMVGRVLALDVRHAQPAADRQLGQAVLLDEAGHDLQGQLEEAGLEDLTADVGVHADQVDVRRCRGRARRPRAGRARRHREPELAVLLAGAHELVGVRLDARRDPHQHRRRRRRLRPERLEPVELVEGVDDDAARRPSASASAQLVDRLVVAVEDERSGGHARRRGARGTPHPWTRRGSCPPRTRAWPWPGTGTPWWRSSRRAPNAATASRQRARGAPRRRRTAACRTARPARPRRSRRAASRPSASTVALSGSSERGRTLTSTPARSRRAGRARRAARPRPPRPARAAPGSARARRRHPSRSSRGRSRGTRRPARAPTW